MHPILLATVLLGTPGVPSAPGAEHFVRCDSIRGLPRDTAQSRRFMEGFREALNQGEVAIERKGTSGWKAGNPAPNRFRSFEGGYARDLWTLQLFVRLPQTSSGAWQGHYVMGSSGGGNPVGIWVPPSFGSIVSKKRHSRGMVVVAMALAPYEADAGEKATPLQAAIAFPGPAATPPEGATVLPPLSGYDFPWRDAGRAAGLIALEALHRRSGDLPTDQRMVLAPGLRVEQEP